MCSVLPTVSKTSTEYGSLALQAPILDSDSVLIDRRNYTFCVDMAAAVASPLALEPMVFSGDVMQYRKWVKQFENIIEPTVKDNHLRLFYLEKYTAGEAREVIEGFLQVRRGMLEKMRLGMLTTYSQCKFSIEFLEKLGQNCICNYRLSVSGNSKIMHCGILINTPYCFYKEMYPCYDHLDNLSFHDGLSCFI